MTHDKETIFAAVASRLSAVSGIRTTGRKVKHFDDVAPAEQPALFVEQTGVEYVGKTGNPSKQTLKANVLIYAWDDTSVGPMPAINALVDKVENLFGRQTDDPGATYTTTLGGLVGSARVVGVEYAGGNLGNQGAAIVSLEIVTA
jgi:hypothetical protein